MHHGLLETLMFAQAVKKFLRVLWTLRVFYHVHKVLPLVPVLSHSSYILPYFRKSNLKASSLLRHTSSLPPGFRLVLHVQLFSLYSCYMPCYSPLPVLIPLILSEG
jgi:hypothetical protein